jgi:putative hydrolase of the HAD superfamily
MLKAIVFDYGKVLTLAPTDEDWGRIASVFGVTAEALQGPYWRLREDYDRAVYNALSYWETVAQQLGTSVANAQVEQLVELDNTQWTRENPEMLDFAWRSQKAGLKIGILSNMQSDMLGAMRKKLAWLDRFDVQMYTCEIGTIKPEPKSYHMTLKALGVEPAESVFFDDKQVNVDGALAVGMHAVLFEGAMSTVYDAVERLRADLDGLKTQPSETAS